MNSGQVPRIILVETDEEKREVLAGRLRSQGYDVDATGTAAEAANAALWTAPSAMIADLWMPGISGVQMCRLLRSEPATAHVPIILRAVGDAPRNRFWAERAGAVAYVPKGRIGQLVRALNHALEHADEGSDFFTLMDNVDLRDRIAEHLDRELYDSVLAAEVRALGTCENFSRLFDLFSQFVAQVTTYRWLAVQMFEPPQLGLHAHPLRTDVSEAEARKALECDDIPIMLVEDEDAYEDGSEDTETIIREVWFGGQQIGKVALYPCEPAQENDELMGLVGKELGGPMRMASLVEESQRLASHDSLTGLLNRRAFINASEDEIVRASGQDKAVSCLLLDIDLFKSINDKHGHAAGDAVLVAVGRLLPRAVRPNDPVARWGGEEFVVTLPGVDLDESKEIGERIRESIQALEVPSPDGGIIPVTASIGAATLVGGEDLDGLIERADKAMYAAKVGGRNQLQAAA